MRNKPKEIDINKIVIMRREKERVKEEKIFYLFFSP
jgi:hypothetical protein